MGDTLNVALAFPAFAGSDEWQSIGLNAEIGEGVRLLYSTTSPASGDEIDFATILFSVDPDGDSEGEPKLLVDGSVDPAPRWTAAQEPGGMYRAVFEMAGGALNELRLVEPGQFDIPLSSAASYQDFTRPRFVKPVSASDYAVSAIVDAAKLVLFRKAVKGGYDASVDVCDAINGAIAKTAGGYSAVFKTRVPGPVRQNTIFPGCLHHQAFDETLKPIGPSSKPLGDETVYELDVDVLGDGLVLLATLEDSAILAAGSLSKTGALTIDQRTVLETTGTLNCPGLLVDGKAIDFCAFRELPDEGRDVLVGYAYLGPVQV